jgi:hypothetical protein
VNHLQRQFESLGELSWGNLLFNFHSKQTSLWANH